MTEVAELIERVVTESGKTEKEIRERMDARKEATHGLLSDYGAIYAVAKEFNIEINQQKTEITKISHLTPQMSANVLGRVKAAFEPREFERKDGKRGKVSSIILADETGEIRLTLWDSNTEISKRVKKNDAILVKNGYVKEGMRGMELNAGALTSLTLNPKTDEKLPPLKSTVNKISQLKQDMPSVNVVCRINSIYPASEFEREDGSVGHRASLICEDETGTIRVVLWGELAKQELEAGDIIEIEECYTKLGMNNVLELQAGNRSRVSKSDAKLKLPKIEKKPQLEIGGIGPELQGIAVEGRVLKLYPPRDYSGGQMASLVIGDQTGTIRAVLWNEKAKLSEGIKAGDAVKITNAYTRANLNNEPEIHIGKYGNMTKAKDSNVPELSAIEESLIKEKDIIALEDNDRSTRIAGKVVDIDKRPVIFMTCPECGKKAQSLGGEWFCETCGDITPTPNMITSFTVEDKTGSIRAVAFRQNAQKLLGTDVGEVMNLIGETQDEMAPVEKAKEKMLNKKISLVGNVRFNDFSEQLEFLVDEVV